MSDNIYFAQNLKLEGIDLDPKVTPWIIYGGSYAGAQAAFTRIRKNSPFWGAIASSVSAFLYFFFSFHFFFLFLGLFSSVSLTFLLCSGLNCFVGSDEVYL